MKNVKNLHKSTRWCEAFKQTDKACKDFMNTIPLVTALGSKAMRPRHWTLLKKATGKEFVPPYEVRPGWRTSNRA
jgi:dynein heavy chain, axonemal